MYIYICMYDVCVCVYVDVCTHVCMLAVFICLPVCLSVCVLDGSCVLLAPQALDALNLPCRGPSTTPQTLKFQALQVKVHGFQACIGILKAQ